MGPNSYYTADLTIRPQGLPRPPPGQGSNSEGRPYPTLVVEVGNSESVPSLHDLSTGYFSPRTTIQIYLAIKMFPIRQDGTRAMLALATYVQIKLIRCRTSSYLLVQRLSILIR